MEASEPVVQGALIQIGDEPPHERLWLHDGVLYTLQECEMKATDKPVSAGCPFERAQPDIVAAGPVTYLVGDLEGQYELLDSGQGGFQARVILGDRTARSLAPANEPPRLVLRPARQPAGESVEIVQVVPSLAAPD